MYLCIGRIILMAIEIYTKQGCPACDSAKTTLQNINKPFVEYKFNEDFTREVLLSKFPEAKTFPVIVIDGFHIGGYRELVEIINEEIKDTRKILLEETQYFGA
jgi:glutaredoxin 3